MKQKIDKPDAKDGRWARCCQNMPQGGWTLDTAVCCLVFIGLPVLMIVAAFMSIWNQYEKYEHQKAVEEVPAEQRQPMIEIPIERTVCVKPAEGYCMEYRTNRIRTP